MPGYTDHQLIWSVIIRGKAGETVVDNGAIANLYFIEDIYSWCKVGKLTLSDTQAIWEFLPLVGDEEIDIIYASWMGTDELEREEKKYTFSVYKVSDITDPSTATVGTVERKTKQILDIFFVEKEFYLLNMPHYDRTYCDMLYYDIIKDMSDRYLGISGFVLDEPSPEKVEFFHTGLRTPADNIRWLFERITGDWSGEAGYLYYSNTKETEKSWNLVTLEYLLTEDNPLIIPPDDAIYYIGGAKNINHINHINNLSISNVDKSTIDRLVKCNYLGYDIYRKYMIKREYDYFKSKDRYTMLGLYTLFNGDDLMTLVPKPQEILTGESGDKYMLAECLMDNMYYGEWIKQYCLQQLVSIYVRGHVMRYAGGQIEINWLSANNDEIFNKQMVGRYLVKSITHQFSSYTTPTYTQRMTLIKNGYFDTDAKVTTASKVNVESRLVFSDIPLFKY